MGRAASAHDVPGSLAFGGRHRRWDLPREHETRTPAERRARVINRGGRAGDKCATPGGHGIAGDGGGANFARAALGGYSILTHPSRQIYSPAAAARAARHEPRRDAPWAAATRTGCRSTWGGSART